MTIDEARGWLAFKASMYRYLYCDIDFSDPQSVRDANVESEDYAKSESPILYAILEA